MGKSDRIEASQESMLWGDSSMRECYEVLPVCASKCAHSNTRIE